VAEYLSERGVKSINPYQVVESHADLKFEAHRQEVIEQLELEPLLARNIIQLSNGERRKVSIARALLKDPQLLILDNPFVGLDERFRAKLKVNLENLMRSDMRVLIVGTNQDEIPSGITHILCVQDHRVFAQGTRQTVLNRDATQAPRTASLSDLPVAAASQKNEAKPSQVLVSLKNVSVSYNETKVLQLVCWTVRENEQWALLGPNGAGKTTLLGLIMGDNPQAYANDITLFGRRRGSGETIWEIKQHIGWVAPELQLYYPRGATCFDVVCSGFFDSVGLYRRCSSDQRETAISWMQRLGISERAMAVFDQISEGEQRLALIARALVKSPALLILDEPCQGLDAGNRDRVLQAVDRVGGRLNTSMIYVTHRADELPKSITHILRLDEGRVIGQSQTRN
jgi:molybdate transport system ATP-binding protein